MSDCNIDNITLYEELRLIEKNENEINSTWRGIHLLLFFLAFVFGSFCTFCFHMLIYLFDENCVLFPKLITLKDFTEDIQESGTGRGHPHSKKFLFDFIDMEDVSALPVDFVTTHWVEKSVCYLPTYVPLLSGICGLIWTTMFLMCSSSSRTLTGLQRPWRILPIVFVFSLAMGCLCTYTTYITQAGLKELCSKLGEIVGSKTCTYTINVATLAYERRIRGVYQATQLTIVSAWLHTFCWLGAALTVLLRVVLVVDFRLVKVKAELRGNIDKMLERHEKLIRTDEFQTTQSGSPTSVKVRFVNKGFGTESFTDKYSSLEELKIIKPENSHGSHRYEDLPDDFSNNDISLVILPDYKSQETLRFDSIEKLPNTTSQKTLTSAQGTKETFLSSMLPSTANNFLVDENELLLQSKESSTLNNDSIKQIREVSSAGLEHAVKNLTEFYEHYKIRSIREHQLVLPSANEEQSRPDANILARIRQYQSSSSMPKEYYIPAEIVLHNDQIKLQKPTTSEKTNKITFKESSLENIQIGDDIVPPDPKETHSLAQKLEEPGPSILAREQNLSNESITSKNKPKKSKIKEKQD